MRNKIYREKYLKSRKLRAVGKQSERFLHRYFTKFKLDPSNISVKLIVNQVNLLKRIEAKKLTISTLERDL